MTKIFFAGKFSFSIFWPFLAKIWPVLAKNALFGPFLLNATINVPDFCHRNLFFGVSKNGKKKSAGKILVFDFLAKLWPLLAKNALFGPFLPNASINLPEFCHMNLFFGLLKNAEKYFRGKIIVLNFLVVLGFFGRSGEPIMPLSCFNYIVLWNMFSQAHFQHCIAIVSYFGYFGPF